ncbi:MAG: hypothetical protein JWO11_3283 [Nocardioides sp.]|nr:hypothetical protein [Nocardioides sp.]
MSTYEPPAGPPADQPPPPPPPPPADGGGAPPPPPPGGGYGAPPAAPEWSIGDALNYGWAKFQANAQQIIIAAVVLVVGLAVVAGIGFVITGALTSSPSCTTDATTFRTTCDGGTSFVVGLILNALVSALLLVAAMVIGAGVVRGALGITEGRAFDFKEVFKTDKLGPVLIASLIIAAATFVGTILCYLPGLVVGFATSYTLYFIIDKDMAPVDAIKASVNLVKDNLANTLIWYIVGGLIAAVGFAICLVGALVSVPVVLIGTAYTYKKLTGQPVAA